MNDSTVRKDNIKEVLIVYSNRQERAIKKFLGFKATFSAEIDHRKSMSLSILLRGGPPWGPSVGALRGGPPWEPSVGAILSCFFLALDLQFYIPVLLFAKKSVLTV